jgi:hypothetical protein
MRGGESKRRGMRGKAGSERNQTRKRQKEEARHKERWSKVESWEP